MASKLTLRIDDYVIAEAKEYAEDYSTSVSQLVSTYLQSLQGKTKKRKSFLSPIVRKLSGVLEDKVDSRSMRREYRESLRKKHK